MTDLNDLKPEHFEHLIGQAMPIVDSEFAFEINAVERLKSPSPRGAPFSLLLLAPARTRGGQGVYHLTHPELGVLPLFLVPIDMVGDRTRFEAVLN
ncbi:MAG: hypothetical protein JNN30_01665 [Rhodanobacteraceae bacterium]|nr:hypothetical protein [Rhodanobacteraceae bacterium]